MSCMLTVVPAAQPNCCINNKQGTQLSMQLLYHNAQLILLKQRVDVLPYSKRSECDDCVTLPTAKASSQAKAGELPQATSSNRQQK